MPRERSLKLLASRNLAFFTLSPQFKSQGSSLKVSVSIHVCLSVWRCQTMVSYLSRHHDIAERGKSRKPCILGPFSSLVKWHLTDSFIYSILSACYVLHGMLGYKNNEDSVPCLEVLIILISGRGSGQREVTSKPGKL